MILFLKKLSVQEKIISLYLTTLFGIYPLYLLSARLQGLTIKGILFCILTAVTAFAFIFLLYQKKLVCRKQPYRIDLCMLSALGLGIWNICVEIFRGGSNYESYLLTSVSVLAYFIISASGDSGKGSFRSSYLDLFLAASAVVYLELLVRLLAFPQLRGPAGLLAEDKTALRAFLVLSLAVDVLQYCSNKNRRKDKWYLIFGAAGFLILSVQKSMTDTLVLSALFFMIPILFLPTAELVRRVFVMAFLYYMILGNLPLLTNYTQLFKTELQFNLWNSLYVDLLLAAAGMAVFSYWERIPGEIPENLIVLRRIQKVLVFLAKLSGILLAALFTVGLSDAIEGRMGSAVIRSLADNLHSGILQADGTFGQILREYGIIGFVLTGIAFALMISRLRKSYECSETSARLTTIAVLFMIQSLFYKQQAVTTPIYAVLVTFALFQEKKEEYHETKKEQKLGRGIAAPGGSHTAMGE